MNQSDPTSQHANKSLRSLETGRAFVDRHIGPDADEQAKMLAVIGYGSLADLVARAIPTSIVDDRDRRSLIPPAASEVEVIAELRALAAMNTVATPMIGLGYFGTHTPAVIRRNVLENPAWYTAYTPYQPEISQGRLEALLNFQTVISDLTGLPVAGASLLDEPTAAAEAMALCRRNSSSSSHRFYVDADVLPQTQAVVQTRALPMGIEVVVADLNNGLPDAECFGVLVQDPGTGGRVRDHAALAAKAHDAGALVVAATDLLALTLLRPPGEWGADIAVGSSQRFGVPLWFGGPHAGFIAVRESLARSLPGRLVGQSIDADGKPAYRLALQTREQHIRREKATSNICTAQVLLAVAASMYAVYHGPQGLTDIARRTHRSASILAEGLRRSGIGIVNDTYFDTVQVSVPGRAALVVAAALEQGINIRRVDAGTVGVSCDETTERRHLAGLWAAFGTDLTAADIDAIDASIDDSYPEPVRRTSNFLRHKVFHQHRSETSMLRYLRSLSDKDVALDRSMIPLGSCTMKLNATTEMEPISWPEFADMHPFAPTEQAAGYASLISQLESWLADVTGYDAVSVQPNAGSQGELAGLLAIRAFHAAQGSVERNVCLIPASAHGTNAASAAMAGMRVVVVACDDDGNIDLDDLRAKLEAHADKLAAIMITYPSTHGVFESTVVDVCAAVHHAGGQVYVDGANLNALVGLARPGRFGADVSHLNLHKTFCIPHGGGGPGVGPVAVRAHLAPYLPNHPLSRVAGPATGPGPISGAPFGSAGVLPIPWAYIRLMGLEGLTRATEVAILSANYLARRLMPSYPVLYTGDGGLVAHECIIDLRPITKDSGVTVEDVAKRLIDYGFHAPTMSFPVAGTLMIEPTESEGLDELDRFVEAMVSIRAEIAKVASGEWDRLDNPLHNAPHTAESMTAEWDHPYSRALAAYPVTALRRGKYWSPVSRIDGAYGDRNLVCSCPPPSAYET
ncbi:MAG TPA: aminomethyl-transferring glycine dehydrogenase [Acidothermaceae bacterium]